MNRPIEEKMSIFFFKMYKIKISKKLLRLPKDGKIKHLILYIKQQNFGNVGFGGNLDFLIFLPKKL